jgi:hypothetical protein
VTGGEAPAPLLLSFPALPSSFMVMAVFGDGKLLFLTCSAREFRKFSRQAYAILLPSGKSKLLSIKSIAKYSVFNHIPGGNPKVATFIFT